jgi:putative nucleotidyltransferase with HDIG domain
LALATLVVALTLFMPLPGVATPEPSLGSWVFGNLGGLLALALVAAGFWAGFCRFCARDADGARRLRNAAALVMLQGFLIRAALEWGRQAENLSWGWLPAGAWMWAPWFLTTGFGAMLLGSRLGVLISVTGVFLLYLRADPGPLPLTGCLVSSLAGILLLRRPTRGRVLRAGAAAGLLLGMIAAVQSGIVGSRLLVVGAAGAIPFLVGVTSAFVVLAVLPVIEWILGEVSDVTLVEYGSEHPLLEQLKDHAPGTWHHTLNVADLAEKAAAAIGARSLFCRTAALYHDVGKLKDPAIFAENIAGSSPHEEMDPRVSAARIIDHVASGLDLARKHRLPKAFREIIAEHHGRSLMRFFYVKACAALREGEDPEGLQSHFRYPGPRPRSRESGIIALADIVEAATRSRSPESELEVRAFVRKLVADRMAEGELADCPLTLAELARAEETFVQWAEARDHHRPAYPRNPVTAVDRTKRPQSAETTRSESHSQLVETPHRVQSLG